MGARDFYRRGDWNAICAVCGFKRKASEMKRRWDGKWLCKQDWEIRHPQELIKGVRDDPARPWTQPEQPDQAAPVPPILP